MKAMMLLSAAGVVLKEKSVVLPSPVAEFR
jgi:hypothetical protein